MNMCLCLTSHYQAMTGYVSHPIMNPQNMFDLLYLTLCYSFKISMFYSFGQLLYFHGIKNKMDNEVQIPQNCNMSKLNFICKIVIGILLNVNGNDLNITVCKISLLVVSRLQTAVNRVLFFFCLIQGYNGSYGGHCSSVLTVGYKSAVHLSWCLHVFTLKQAVKLWRNSDTSQWVSEVHLCLWQQHWNESLRISWTFLSVREIFFEVDLSLLDSDA